MTIFVCSKCPNTWKAEERPDGVLCEECNGSFVDEIKSINNLSL
jgi:protein-arginine kinase activator protein McsA